MNRKLHNLLAGSPVKTDRVLRPRLAWFALLLALLPPQSTTPKRSAQTWLPQEILTTRRHY